MIPLDTGDPTYNVWHTLRDLSGDPAREPGIINVQKREALTGIAMRKLGLTEAHYLSPLTKDDGRE